MLDDAGQRHFRSVTGLIVYLSLDRPDVQFAAKSLSRMLGKATSVSVERAKRVARYLVGSSNLAQEISGSNLTRDKAGHMEAKVACGTDSD